VPPEGVWTTCRHMQSPRELQQLDNWSVNAEIWITTDKVISTNTVEGYYSIFKRGMKGVYQRLAPPPHAPDRGVATPGPRGRPLVKST
jgi:hypothetical protein